MINIVEENKHVLVDVKLTEANLSNADDFKSQITTLLNQKQTSVVLNMAQVSYIDSTFLGALVACLKHALGMKLDVILVGLQPDIHSLIKLIRLDKVFKIYPNYEAVQ